MKKQFMQITGILALSLLMLSCSTGAQEEKACGLKNALADHFYMGAAINDAHILRTDTASLEILDMHFNSIVGENVMKSGPIHPKADLYNWQLADGLVELGLEKDMYIVGHCLVWHSQAPRWFFTDEEGNEVSRDLLIQRMKEHITTVVTRYKGKVDAWDVVNEAFNEDGSWRESPFYKIIGDDFIHLAFEFAHAADPDAELLYNDYNLYKAEKVVAAIKLAKSMKEAGLRIDGIGMQGHYGLSSPSLADVEKSINSIAEAGLDVHITELDVTVLPAPWDNVGANIADKAEYKAVMDPYTEGLTEETEAAMNARWEELMGLYISHSDKIKRVTTWGIADPNSWKNGWPIPGRTDYALLFDRNYEPKAAVAAIMETAKGEKTE